jgi:hypothetical protein
VTKWINGFCPRGFTAITLPDPVLGGRSIRIPLLRTADGRKANLDPSDIELWPVDRGKLQDDLWATALSLMKEAEQVSRELNHEVDLVGRDFEPWRAILLAARLFQRHGVVGLEARMRQVMQAYQKEKADNDIQDRAVQVLKAIVHLRQTETSVKSDVSDVSDKSDVSLGSQKKINVNATALSNAIKSIGEEEEFDTEWANPKSVGRQLSALRFSPGRDSKTKKGDRFRSITERAFAALCLAYRVVNNQGENQGNNYSDPGYKTSETSETSGTNRPSDEDGPLGPEPAHPQEPKDTESGGTAEDVPDVEGEF